MGWYRIEDQGAGGEVQTKTVTATTETINVFPDDGYALSLVTVNPQEHTQTTSIAQRTTQYDLGINHNTRYINTNGVPNNNTSRVQLTARDTLDLGATNNVRYVDTTKVPSGAAYEQTLYTNPYPNVAYAGGVVSTLSLLPPQIVGTKRYLRITYKDINEEEDESKFHTIDFPWDVTYVGMSGGFDNSGVIGLFLGNTFGVVTRRIFTYIEGSNYKTVISKMYGINENVYLIPISLKLIDKY